MDIQYSKHALKRSQQRAIPTMISDWLVLHGERCHLGEGVKILFFNKKTRKLLKKEFGSLIYGKFSGYLNIYVIQCVSSGTIITVGRRYIKRRIKNKWRKSCGY